MLQLYMYTVDMCASILLGHTVANTTVYSAVGQLD